MRAQVISVCQAILPEEKVRLPDAIDVAFKFKHCLMNFELWLKWCDGQGDSLLQVFICKCTVVLVLHHVHCWERRFAAVGWCEHHQNVNAIFCRRGKLAAVTIFVQKAVTALSLFQCNVFFFLLWLKAFLILYPISPVTKATVAPTAFVIKKK